MSASPRAHLHASIQATVALDVPGEAEPIPEGSMLLGFVAVAEWMAPDGTRWLSRVDAGASGDKGLTEWQREGYLHNALNSASWIEDEDET